jgi:hypothetical protein
VRFSPAAPAPCCVMPCSPGTTQPPPSHLQQRTAHLASAPTATCAVCATAGYLQRPCQHSADVCCAVLCCAVLCCAVLCCAVLCCAVLCCAVLCPHHAAAIGPCMMAQHDRPQHGNEAAASPSTHWRYAPAPACPAAAAHLGQTPLGRSPARPASRCLSRPGPAAASAWPLRAGSRRRPSCRSGSAPPVSTPAAGRMRGGCT